MLLPQSFPEHFQCLYLPNFIPSTFKEKDGHTRISKKPQAQNTVALDDYLLSVVNTQGVSPL